MGIFQNAGVLASSFIHGQGVGPSTERRLWRSGAHDWPAFLALARGGRLRGKRMVQLAEVVQASQAALAAGHIEFFGERLPPAELWRLHGSFSQQAAYFDIETTGLSPGLDVVTVVGLYDGRSFQAFVRGQNLDDFPRAAASHALLVSYNGATFDLPFLQATFQGFAPRAHLDLRYPLARLGYRGGLKEIERRAGIRRPGHLAELSGFDAVRLWHEHERGDAEALATLIAYTREDVVNLSALADLVAAQMPAQLGFPGARELSRGGGERGDAAMRCCP